MEELLYKLEEIRNNKSEAVKSQKYEQASYLRDQEKQVYQEIYKFLNGDDNYKWVSDDIVNESIKDYLENKHNIKIDKEDIKNYNFKELIRKIKLSKLGL